jgi:hypothetical protein
MRVSKGSVSQMKLQDARLEKDSSCTECGSTNIVFGEVFRFCTSCTHLWAHDEDDPDYDDIVDFGDDYPDYKRVTPWS